MLRRPPLDRPLTLANTVRACGFLLVTWLFYGLSLLALARPLGLTGAGSLALATGAYALAWSAGVMVLGLVPAGIGVREVVLGAILLPFLPAGAATAVVATSRVVQTLGDALWALFAGIALRGPMRRAEQRLRTDPPAPAEGGGPGPDRRIGLGDRRHRRAWRRSGTPPRPGVRATDGSGRYGTMGYRSSRPDR